MSYHISKIPTKNVYGLQKNFDDTKISRFHWDTVQKSHPMWHLFRKGGFFTNAEEEGPLISFPRVVGNAVADAKCGLILAGPLQMFVITSEKL